MGFKGLVLFAGAAAFIWLASLYFRRTLGGVTGDALGAANEFVEVLVLCGALLLVKSRSRLFTFLQFSAKIIDEALGERRPRPAASILGLSHLLSQVLFTLRFLLSIETEKQIYLEAAMLPDVIELRAKIKEFKDRLEVLRGHL